MINVYCLLVKPSYNIKYVERLYAKIKNNLSSDFNFFCLTDSIWHTALPIVFLDVKPFNLDYWWNKLAMFSNEYSAEGNNLYFDLDIDIIGNIDFLVNDIEINKLCVVDTLWKDGNFVVDGLNTRRGSSFYCYGNTSVMGWKDNSQTHLLENIIKNPFITTEHFGDDTYLNQNGNIKYFSRLICNVNSSRYMKSMIDKRIVTHYKTPPI